MFKGRNKERVVSKRGLGGETEARKTMRGKRSVRTGSMGLVCRCTKNNGLGPIKKKEKGKEKKDCPLGTKRRTVCGSEHHHHEATWKEKWMLVADLFVLPASLEAAARTVTGR